LITEAAMPKQPIPENTGRVIAVALVAWGTAVAWAALDGVLARSDPTVALALAVFAAAYALSTYALDRGVRELVDRIPRSHLAVAAVGADALSLLAAAGLRGGEPLAGLACVPFAMLAYFGMPLAVVAHVAVLRRRPPPCLRSSAARSPGATPAAP
jgi:hypothetical protein